MLLFKFKPTEKTVLWLEEHKINCLAMEAALTLLYSEIEPTILTRSKTLTIQVLYGADASEYTFTTDKICLCDKPDDNVKSNKQMKLAVFDHFLHEFRHWMQSKVYKVSWTKLTYDEDDVQRNSHAYFRNEYEVDARRFARAYLKKYYRYYKHFEKR